MAVNKRRDAIQEVTTAGETCAVSPWAKLDRTIGWRQIVRKPGIHRRGHCHPRSLHRRQYGDLFDRERSLRPNSPLE